ncbi:MAG: CapA family protein [Sphaerochaeta associata]|uniref:CapA family protein n=1 Tax=Sphaerochaeta associata TaxID=1129264 RepID=UPI002B21BB93|nr:CapA family protein [Sphaerochaeta associata]MEA5108648.1 CapA family protein [Sphaerochaeta associata]
MKIALIGDIGLFGRNSLVDTRQEDLEKYLEPLASRLRAYDVVIGNLEAPFTKSNKIIGGKSAYLKSNPQNVQLLKFLNIQYVNLANNHMYDYDYQGYKETIQVLENAGIYHFGTEDNVCLIEENNNSIVLRGYCCYSTNPKGIMDGKKKNRVVNPLSFRRIETDLKTDSNNNQLSLLSCHWGEEHIHYPNPAHVLMSRQLAQKYNFIIHGHHPHVLQGIEKVNSSLISYSLGNALFDDVYTSKSNDPLITLSEANRTAGIIEIEIENNTIPRWEFIPYVFSHDMISFENVENIHDIMQSWSNSLTIDDAYISRRDQIRSEYIASRKNMRNLKWYISRLNLNSLKMIYDGKQNKKNFYN